MNDYGFLSIIPPLLTIVVALYSKKEVAPDNLVIKANLGWLDASYNDYEADLTGDGIVTDNSDLELRRTPDWTGGINATYTRTIGPGCLPYAFDLY